MRLPGRRDRCSGRSDARNVGGQEVDAVTVEVAVGLSLVPDETRLMNHRWPVGGPLANALA